MGIEALESYGEVPTYLAVVKQRKGGDPMSHCHMPHTAVLMSWISTAGVRLG